MITERRRLVLGTSWTFASTLVALVVGAILNPVLVLFLGVGGYGIWASAIAVASLFGMAGDLGVSGALTKLMSEREAKREKAGSFVASSLVFGVIAGGVTGFALAIVARFVEVSSGYSNFGLLLGLQALQMPFNMGTASLLGLLQGRRHFRALAQLTMVQSAAGLSLSIGFLATGQGLIGVMVASSLASVLVFAILLTLSRREIALGSLPMIKADLRRLIPFGIKLTATNAVSTILYQVDIVVLSFLTGDPVSVGTYALAIFITRAFWILPGSVSTTTYPVTSQYAAANDWRRVSTFVSTAFLGSIAIIGVLASALILFGRPVLLVVFGPTSLGAYDMSLILLAGTCVLGCLRSIASSISGVGRPGVGLRVSAVGAGVLAILAILLTRAFGTLGTAIAVTLTFGLVAILLVREVDRHVLGLAGTRLVTNKVVRTATVALAGGVASLFLSLPPAPSLGAVVVASVLLTGIGVALGSASGGRDTWGGFLRLARRVPSERE